jgi:hypothetical protein
MPAAPGAPYDLADAVFRVGRAYGMTADRSVYQAVAVKDGRISAVGRSRDELDSFIGPGTSVIDDPELVLYPAFNDTHNHQLLAARDLDYVSLEQARSIDELVQALREAAARTPPGGWIISSRCWHETHLREGRLPTARELDAASAGRCTTPMACSARPGLPRPGDSMTSFAARPDVRTAGAGLAWCAFRILGVRAPGIRRLLTLLIAA